MNLLDATQQAMVLLFSGDAELWQIICVSLLALLLITPICIAAGFALATTQFPGRRLVVILVQSLLSFPTVVVGLLLYLLLSRQGIFGDWQLLFTQQAMNIGQAIIAFPVLAAFTLSAVQGAAPRVQDSRLLPQEEA